MLMRAIAWRRLVLLAVVLTSAAIVQACWRTHAAQACDVCAIYAATALQETRRGPWLGIAQQFTRFDTEQADGQQVANPGEWMDSSITQLLVGYNLDHRWGFQISLPYIVKSYRRMEETGLNDGRTSGIGDAALLGRFHALNFAGAETILRVSMLGGFKLATGDSNRLGEELDEPGEEDGHEVSGIHGHDLALGSGSIDGIVGATAFASWQRLFVSGAIQYKITTEGDFDYEYADELSYAAGPGIYVLLDPAYSVALQADFSGEAKGTDRQAGERVGDSAMTALYAGPRVHATYKRALQFEFGGELPLIQNNSGLQVVPDYRLRGGLVWHF